MKFSKWLIEGLRAGVFLRPRVSGSPLPMQLVGIALLAAAIELALARLEIDGAASFNLRAWLAPWWSTGVLVVLAWWAVQPAAAMELEPQRPAGVAAWMMLWMGAMLPATLVGQALSILQARGQLPAFLQGGWMAWAVYVGMYAWALTVAVRLARLFGAPPLRAGVLAGGLLTVLAITAWQFEERPWYAERPPGDGPKFELSQDAFESQQALWRQTVSQLAPERAGVVDVYGLVFAPYAPEDVFLRESAMVAGVLASRFDAQGRVLHLINNAATATTHPWATRQNLERAIEAIGARMDRDRDVLVVYMTSHGASDFKLAAYHWPLAVEPVSPGELRAALDKAGIRHRVIAVSACYSGGWVGPLAGPGTLVMTAADERNTSYGCGRLSPLTFFGRALFDEELRKTHSFEKAFAAAVPVIKKREEEGGKPDGFSNPQISVGAAIAPVLKELETRLEALPTKAAP